MSRNGSGLFDRMSGVGVHEVIIETDSHRQPFHELPLPRIAGVLRAVPDRILDLSGDIRLRAITYFKNSGAIACSRMTNCGRSGRNSRRCRRRWQRILSSVC
jgi:UDPglucose--hexose-1-phosphate uridylyltransferase